MSKVLVTGGAGFIGSHLTEALLREGHRVRVLDDFSTGKRENLIFDKKYPSLEIIEGDIRHLAICHWFNSFSNAVKRQAISAVGGKPVGIALAARSSRMILPMRLSQRVPSTRNHWNGETRKTFSFVCRTSKNKLRP